MTETSTRSWAKLALAAGGAAVLAYFSVAANLFPLRVGRVLFFLFGPLLILSAVGLYHALRRHCPPLWLQSAVLFNIIAGALVTTMAVVQQALFASLRPHLREPGDADGRAVLEEIFRGVNTVQLGLDVAWDIFVFLGTFFLALALWRHPRYGKWFAAPGLLIALLGLLLNLATFPTPPAEGGLVDAGPLMGLWYAVILVQLARSLRWLAGAQAETASIHP